MARDAEDDRGNGAERQNAEAGGSTPPEPGQLLDGTIVEADDLRLIVRLPSGHQGIARFAGVERSSGKGNGPKVGEAVRVRVLGLTADHQARVELLLPEAPDTEGDPFDQEMHRLSNALRQQSTAVTAHNSSQEASIEGRIAGWIGEITAGLERMQAHRSDRLSREFYDDEGKDGGSRA